MIQYDTIRCPLALAGTLEISNNVLEKELKCPHCLGMSYFVNFLEGIGSNEFHIK